jgi:hypothetical protein
VYINKRYITGTKSEESRGKERGAPVDCLLLTATASLNHWSPKIPALILLLFFLRLVFRKNIN